MNFGMMFIFIILQLVINYFLGIIIPTDSLEGIIAYYLLSSFLISFIAALISTPREYRKTFYKQSGFHKTMLVYFILFSVFDALSVIFSLIR